jgi:fructuronate reductase
MERPRLSERTVAQARAGTLGPTYVRADCRIGWVHFGPGAFHRAHQAAYADRLLGSDPRWAISAVALHSATARAALGPQDYLYGLLELAEVPQLRLIGALREILLAPTDRAAVFTRLEAPTTAIVTLTVTEKGYCLDADGVLDVSHPDIAHDLAKRATPRSVIGFLVEGLRRRRACGRRPFVLISCDNLPANGPTLLGALVAFARQSDAALADWIAAEVTCPRTMVDSITPATDAALIERAAQMSGLQDAWPVQRECFTQWVIEDLPEVRVADWAAVGVTLAREVSLYEQAKLRIVNGAHSALAYIGLLRGRATVAEAMADRPLARFLEQLLREDLGASLPSLAGVDVAAYRAATLERLRNPSVRHQLVQIAWDGSKKLPVRLLPVVAEALAAGRPVARLALPIAAWMRFVIGRARSGELLIDPAAQRLLRLGAACTGEPQRDVARFLAMPEMFPPPIAAAPPFQQALRAAYGALGACGAIPAPLGGDA